MVKFNKYEKWKIWRKDLKINMKYKERGLLVFLMLVNVFIC